MVVMIRSVARLSDVGRRTVSAGVLQRPVALSSSAMTFFLEWQPQDFAAAVGEKHPI